MSSPTTVLPEYVFLSQLTVLVWIPLRDITQPMKEEDFKLLPTTKQRKSLSNQPISIPVAQLKPQLDAQTALAVNSLRTAFLSKAVGIPNILSDAETELVLKPSAMMITMKIFALQV